MNSLSFLIAYVFFFFFPEEMVVSVDKNIVGIRISDKTNKAGIVLDRQ